MTWDESRWSISPYTVQVDGASLDAAATGSSDLSPMRAGYITTFGICISLPRHATVPGNWEERSTIGHKI